MYHIGYLAAFLTTFSFVPQAIKTLRTRDTEGLSLLMYVSFVIGVFLWFLHGIHKMDWAIIVANFITFWLAFAVLTVIIANRRRDQALVDAASETR